MGSGVWTSLPTIDSAQLVQYAADSMSTEQAGQHAVLHCTHPSSYVVWLPHAHAALMAASWRYQKVLQVSFQDRADSAVDPD